MNYFASASTDVGIVKKTNQDSVCVKIAEFEGYGQVVMAIICDGMGGLKFGELASATVIRRFSSWFEKELPKKFENFSWQTIAKEWNRITKEQNQKLINHGKMLTSRLREEGKLRSNEDVQLGTTLSAMLIVNDKYMIVHVGDSRVYEIADGVKQMTEDQTFVSREIKEGRMTPQQAAVHPYRNKLLQCLGAFGDVNPDILFGNIKVNTVYMLCSDGFRHVLTDSEIFDKFNPVSVKNEDIMKQNSDYLIDVVKKRNERDNITVALLKSVM